MTHTQLIEQIGNASREEMIAHVENHRRLIARFEQDGETQKAAEFRERLTALLKELSA